MSAPETDVPKILFASFATAIAGGIPINIYTGIFEKPPPIPKRPEMKPIIKLNNNIINILI